MVTFTKSDLDFILQQIVIAEQLAGGANPADLIPHYSLPYGLRQVNGENNNLLHPEFGAADTIFPRLVPTNPVNREPTANPADGETFDNNGPAPGGLQTNNNYGVGGNVVDSAPRTISNLIADQTYHNPAAVAAAIRVAGIGGAEAEQAQIDILSAGQLADSTTTALVAAQAAVDASAALLGSGAGNASALVAAALAAQATAAADAAAAATAATAAAAAQNAADAALAAYNALLAADVSPAAIAAVQAAYNAAAANAASLANAATAAASTAAASAQAATDANTLAATAAATVVAAQAALDAATSASNAADAAAATAQTAATDAQNAEDAAAAALATAASDLSSAQSADLAAQAQAASDATARDAAIAQAAVEQAQADASAAAVQSAQQAADTAQTAVDDAQAALDLLLESPPVDPDQQAALEAALATAQSGLITAQADLASAIVTSNAESAEALAAQALAANATTLADASAAAAVVTAAAVVAAQTAVTEATNALTAATANSIAADGALAVATANAAAAQASEDSATTALGEAVTAAAAAAAAAATAAATAAADAAAAAAAQAAANAAAATAGNLLAALNALIDGDIDQGTIDAAQAAADQAQDDADAAAALATTLNQQAQASAQAAIDAAAAAVGFEDHAALVAARDAAAAAAADAQQDFDTLLAGLGIEIASDGTLFIPNVATDEGLSASYNSWFTLFGQFFDHGLDLVTKGGNGTVYIPLQPDDPLITHGADGIAGTGDELTNPAQQFLTLTRATPTMVPGDANGDGTVAPGEVVAEHTNTTTSWVDQNQTYTSHPSHQVFPREYVLNGNGDPVATGRLLENRAPNLAGEYFGVGSTNLGGLASWAVVKAQASELLGINLTDADVGNVPLLRTDEYGKFIPGPNGYAQVITGLGTDGIPNTIDDIVVEGNPAANGGVGVSLATAIRTGHAFLDDIAHSAGPVFIDHDNNPLTPRVLAPDADGVAGNQVAINPTTGQRLEYDNELLDAHKVTGDGRGNENIGLTTVHHVFHSEHNRLVEHTKEVAIASAIEVGGAAGVALLNAWLDPASQVTTLPANQAQIDALVWNGERIFQAAKFGTEMQYQHLVFEEFARKVQPLVNLFGPYNAEIDPSIVAEFAHVVYRFGHSMLDEDVARMNPDGTSNDVGLIEAFLNPIMFDAAGTAEVAAGAIIRGMTRQVGNEIDEFVTGALRNNLLGLPLDLGVLNLARARDTGSPTLNEARAQFYAGTGDAQLKPYESWVDFAQHTKNELSVVNFIAAYGNHAAVLAAVTLEDKRKAATALVLGDNDATPNTVTINGNEIDISDRLDFLNSTGTWTAANSGLNDIDLWIGGLAEAQQPFGGLLGSTFNFVFETQMEHLQDSDRFYYLARLAGTHFLTELEGNSFAQMVINNTNLGEDGMHLPADIFSVPNWILEVDQTKQVTGLDANGDPVTTGVGRGDPTGGSLFTPLVVRDDPNTVGPDTNYLKYTGGDHVVLGGTNANDTLIASIGDDTVWGDEGNDRIEGGAGVDALIGGGGDDIITDINGDDNIKGGAGDDVVNSGDGFDLILLGDGNDFSIGGEDANETFGGEGNDFIIAGDDADTVFGDGGNDWIEGGTGNDLLQGDFGAPFQDSSHVGNDVIMGGAGNDDYDSESGDDIMLAEDGIERNEGMLGFDWVTYKNDTRAANADMAFTGLLPPDLDALRDRFDLVEGLSGWDFNDVLRGDNADAALLSNIDVASGQNNAINNVGQINLISGLQNLLGAGVTSFNGGNIILGGGGSDIIEGRGGDDIIDGDAKLNVRLSIRANLDGTGAEIGTADGMTTPVVSSNPALNGKSLVELMFAGTLNPGQLEIVREIITDDTSGVDVALFSGASAEYEVSIDDNGTATLSDDVVTVAHRLLDANGIIVPGSVGADGIDTVRNVELLQFADGAQILDPSIVNAAATGRLEIVDGGAAGITIGEPLTVSIGTVADADGVPALATFAITWQVEATLGAGDWVALVDPVTEAPIVGPSFTPTAAFELDGLRLRVVATFIDNHGIPETVVSLPTEPVAPAAATAATEGDDILLGTVGPDVIQGLAGDDVISGLAGNDILIGGRLPVGLTPGDNAGNDILDGGTDTGGLGDIAVFFGPLANFTFAFNAEGQLEVIDAAAAQEDAILNIETVRIIDGATVIDIAVASILAGLPTPATDGADLITGTANADDIAGLGGNDTILAGDGDDVIEWTAGDGIDIVDGGIGTDRFRVRGANLDETFFIETVAEFTTRTGLVPQSATTNIVISRVVAGVGANEVVAELTGIDEIDINGGGGADVFVVSGNFAGTDLDPNTITITGTTGNDIIDIRGLSSSHRIVVQSNGGNDIILGDLRPQDIVQLAPGTSVADYTITSSQSSSTISNGTNSVNFNAGFIGNFVGTEPGNIGPQVNPNNGGANDAVIEGGVDSLRFEQFGVSDPDNLPIEIVFTVTGTTAGLVLLDDVPVLEGQTFTGQDLLDGRVAFAHDDTEGTTASVAFTVTDGVSAPVAGTLNLDVTPVNEAPTEVGFSGTSVDESAAAGTVVGTLAGVDPDTGDTLTFTFADGTTVSGPFEIVGNQLLVRAGAVLDADATASHTIEIRAVDAAGLASPVESYTITVNNVNEAPTGVSLSNATVIEGAANGTVVGLLSASDEDAGDTHSFVFADGTTASGAFAIVGNELRVLDGVRLDHEQVAAVTLGIRAVDASGLSSPLADIQITIADANPERITGTMTADSLVGGSGNDTLLGLAGSDTLIGGSGADLLSGFNNSDSLIGGAGNDTISGGNGHDTMDGGDDADVMNGDLGNDLMQGGAGSDQMNGAVGNDTMDGGAGADMVHGSFGNDVVRGGDDNDTVTGGDGHDQLDGGTGADQMWGGAGNDTFLVDNVERLRFVGTGDFTGTGSIAANVITGGAGNDVIDGRRGNDTIIGGAGNDTISGGADSDTLVFAAGFGNDVVLGFDANPLGGQDLLDLTGLGISAADFASKVSITDTGADTLVTIVDTGETIELRGLANATTVTIEDFRLVA